MGYRKVIACLAKSIKHGGYCIAGKELVSDREGGWIRPVSDREDEEISIVECRCGDGAEPDLLDLLSIPMLQPRPSAYQSENHLIDPELPWNKQGRITYQDCISLIDTVEGPLWSNGYSSFYGTNDRLPQEVAAGFSHSLVLIRPEDLAVCVETEGAEFGNPRRRTRAAFSLNGQRYKLVVTDPLIREQYRSHPGRHTISGGGVALC